MGPRILCGMDGQKELCDLAGNRTRSKLSQCKTLLVELYWLHVVYRQYTRCSVLQWNHNLYSQPYQLLTFLLKFLPDVTFVNSQILLITFVNFMCLFFYLIRCSYSLLTFSVRHLNAIKSTAGRRF
jgi:hypothetical protein